MLYSLYFASHAKFYNIADIPPKEICGFQAVKTQPYDQKRTEIKPSILLSSPYLTMLRRTLVDCLWRLFKRILAIVWRWLRPLIVLVAPSCRITTSRLSFPVLHQRQWYQ